MNNSWTLDCAPRSGGSEAPRRAAHVHHTRAARARVNRVQRAGADAVNPRGGGHEVPVEAARSRLKPCGATHHAKSEAAAVSRAARRHGVAKGTGRARSGTPQ